MWRRLPVTPEVVAMMNAITGYPDVLRAGGVRPEAATAEGVAQAMMILSQQGYRLVSAEEEILPRRVQGAIEIHDIFETMKDQGFSEEQALTLTVAILQVGSRA